MPHFFQIPFNPGEPGVDHLLDAQQLFVEELFEGREALIHITEANVDVSSQIAKPRIVDEDAYENGDRRHGNAQDDLNVFHDPKYKGLPLFAS
jgi:hypothetical protein